MQPLAEPKNFRIFSGTSGFFNSLPPSHATESVFRSSGHQRELAGRHITTTGKSTELLTAPLPCRENRSSDPRATGPWTRLGDLFVAECPRWGIYIGGIYIGAGSKGLPPHRQIKEWGIYIGRPFEQVVGVRFTTSLSKQTSVWRVPQSSL